MEEISKQIRSILDSINENEEFIISIPLGVKEEDDNGKEKV